MTEHLQINWMVRSDLPAVLDIESACFGLDCWTEEDFLARLRQRNAIGMVAKLGSAGRIVGFMVYELHKTRLNLLNIAVHPGFHRRGIGRAMVNRLIDKLPQQRRRFLAAKVWERNLTAQRFFAAMGLKAIRVNRGDLDNGDDTYTFSFRLPRWEPTQEVATCERFS